MNDPRPKRTVKSFARSQGRLTDGQKKAIDSLWAKYAIDLPSNKQPIILAEHFPADKPLTMEIGFGNGESLLQEIEKSPESSFLGVEVYRPGVGHFLGGLEAQQAANAKVIAHDAMDVVEFFLPESCIDRIQIFFPDPWPKKRHHKRRLVQLSFVQKLLRVLKPGGVIHVATDWQDYAEHAMEVLSAVAELENQAGVNCYSERPDYRSLTKFERRGLRLGHGVWDLLFSKKS